MLLESDYQRNSLYLFPKGRFWEDLLVRMYSCASSLLLFISALMGFLEFVLDPTKLNDCKFISLSGLLNNNNMLIYF